MIHLTIFLGTHITFATTFVFAIASIDGISTLALSALSNPPHERYRSDQKDDWAFLVRISDEYSSLLAVVFWRGGPTLAT